MKRFQTRQEKLGFNCICEICKKGPEHDIEAFEEYERLIEEKKKLQSDHKEGGCANCAPDQPSRYMKMVTCAEKAYNLAMKNRKHGT